MEARNGPGDMYIAHMHDLQVFYHALLNAGVTESSLQASVELANPSKQSKQNSSSSRVCILL